MKKTLICLIGPTAVGKTEVALKLAQEIGADIISCDSMQIYKGIDIATSKPTKKQRRKVPHHFIDIVSPSQEYNAARFRKSCLKAIKEIHCRGKIPLIVAGTGLYLRVLLDGLFTGPGQNKYLRKKLYRQAHRYGVSSFYQKLKDLDPQAAKTVHPQDLRRIIRALEVYKLTKRPISEWREKTYGLRDRYNLYLFGLQREREELYTRVETRVDKMFRRGLVTEIKRLSKQKVSKTAKSLLGYKEIIGFLKGMYSCEQARELLKKNTRRYAKRQLSWFRKEKGINWIEFGAEDTPEAIAKKILMQLKTKDNLAIK